jgi:hypothetical protein
LIALVKDKRILSVLSGFIVFIIIFSLGIYLLSSQRKEIKLLQEQRKELMMLRDDFLFLKQKVDMVENRKNISNIQGIAQAVEEVFSSVGLRDRIKTVKTTGKREIKDGFEEEADISIEKVSMNEMVNIFYRIENAPMVLSVKKATIKKSFENPELLNITFSLSFLKTK